MEFNKRENSGAWSAEHSAFSSRNSVLVLYELATTEIIPLSKKLNRIKLITDNFDVYIII